LPDRQRRRTETAAPESSDDFHRQGAAAMSQTAIYNRDFNSLKDTHTVAEAAQRMLDDRVSDLPVVDAAGKLVGMFKLDRLLAGLLPKAALLGYGVPDLTFVSDTLAQLRERMRGIDARLVREFTVMPDHIVHPDTTPVEIVLLLYRGAGNVPVVARDTGQLIAMVAARDVLNALHDRGAR
jgi:CBS-domain-containing membrane protein